MIMMMHAKMEKGRGPKKKKKGGNLSKRLILSLYRW